jgi:hypothetical protein
MLSNKYDSKFDFVSILACLLKAETVHSGNTSVARLCKRYVTADYGGNKGNTRNSGIVGSGVFYAMNCNGYVTLHKSNDKKSCFLCGPCRCCITRNLGATLNWIGFR